MGLDPIIPPPRWAPRTETERLQAQLADQRARTAPEDRTITLPISLGPDHRLAGCPPSSMFQTEEEQ